VYFFHCVIGITIKNPRFGVGHNFSSPPPGAYILGDFPEDCLLRSITAYGPRGKGGLLNDLSFYVIRDEGSTLAVQDRFTLTANQTQITIFDTAKHPKKGDFIAIRVQRGIRIAFKGNERYRVFKMKSIQNSRLSDWKYVDMTMELNVELIANSE
jgi:hypothetical protein